MSRFFAGGAQDEGKTFLNQYEVLELLAGERSSWHDMRHYPSATNCRMMLALADWASTVPMKQWEACRLFFEQELPQKEIARLLRISQSSVSLYLAASAVFPAEEYGERVEEESVRTLRATETYRNTIALCGHTCTFPMRWRVLRVVHGCPHLSISEVAMVCGTSLRTASRSLRPTRLYVPEELPPYRTIDPKSEAALPRSMRTRTNSPA